MSLSTTSRSTINIRLEPDARHRPPDDVDVVIRRSGRSRSIRIDVDDHGVITAAVPQRIAMRQVEQVVRERSDWLRDALHRAHHARQAAAVDLAAGDPVRLAGTWIPSRLTTGLRAGCRLREGVLEIRVPEAADPHDVLIRWYRAHARKVISDRVDFYAGIFGLKPGKISIRDQRTRWGSCNHRGDLSFNWRLVLAPPWVLDSIVVHELCHLDVLDHSPHFWATLDARYPRHREASEWLRVHGASLRVLKPSDAGPAGDASVSGGESCTVGTLGTAARHGAVAARDGSSRVGQQPANHVPKRRRQGRRQRAMQAFRSLF